MLKTKAAYKLTWHYAVTGLCEICNMLVTVSKHGMFVCDSQYLCLWICWSQVTSGHSLIDVHDPVECEQHSGEPVRFYCDTCHVGVCVLCTYHGQPHSDNHNVLSFTDAASIYQPPFTALHVDCRRRLSDMRARYDALVTFNQLVRKVR